MTGLRYLCVTALAVIGITAAAMVDMPVKLIWNATASAPIGFYTVEPAGRIEVPELVAIMPPEPLAGFMVGRGYVARDVPLLKRVLGLPGQRKRDAALSAACAGDGGQGGPAVCAKAAGDCHRFGAGHAAGRHQ